MSSHTSPTEPNPDQRDRCLQYLLGELSAEQAASFECELDDPRIAEMLERESGLLLDIASIAPSAFAASPSPSQTTTPSSRRVLLVIAATAAVLLVAVGLLNRHRIDAGDDSFDLQLAKTWVRPAIDWPLQDTDEAIESAEPIDVPNSEPKDEASGDEDLQWLVAAVQASLEEQHDDG